MHHAHGILDHVDETGMEPVDPIPADIQTSGEKLSDEQKVLVNEWTKELKEWKQGEAITKQQIVSSILDSLFMKIHSKPMAHKIWVAELKSHFQN